MTNKVLKSTFAINGLFLLDNREISILAFSFAWMKQQPLDLTWYHARKGFAEFNITHKILT